MKQITVRVKRAKQSKMVTHAPSRFPQLKRLLIHTRRRVNLRSVFLNLRTPPREAVQNLSSRMRDTFHQQTYAIAGRSTHALRCRSEMLSLAEVRIVNHERSSKVGEAAACCCCCWSTASPESSIRWRGACGDVHSRLMTDPPSDLSVKALLCIMHLVNPLPCAFKLYA
ncbi:hypothetical protein IE81DRAFT_84631 [Ceraceosorus guamensis]|uniref:Uncharacterized protein n=1 Tax=Ceraceosorus guamensis TaxID=1522189 RepID=A0A316WG01_9BASI|nr:hypothetical protein IE81DRAFT_84631 [Ceraceosorus guamensis]PWN46145.1 hypothetical protein IE81DRAFT_84631 [Ceraceosorus guamensis]